uniref:Uncharacterized protein n=1 Tax=Acrobeloides nanus TaxID=290746 RepID=A0A914CCK0_9BILA
MEQKIRYIDMLRKKIEYNENGRKVTFHDPSLIYQIRITHINENRSLTLGYNDSEGFHIPIQNSTNNEFYDLGINKMTTLAHKWSNQCRRNRQSGTITQPNGLDNRKGGRYVDMMMSKHMTPRIDFSDIYSWVSDVLKNNLTKFDRLQFDQFPNTGFYIKKAYIDTKDRYDEFQKINNISILFDICNEFGSVFNDIINFDQLVSLLDLVLFLTIKFQRGSNILEKDVHDLNALVRDIIEGVKAVSENDWKRYVGISVIKPYQKHEVVIQILQNQSGELHFRSKAHFVYHAIKHFFDGNYVRITDLKTKCSSIESFKENILNQYHNETSEVIRLCQNSPPNGRIIVTYEQLGGRKSLSFNKELNRKHLARAKLNSEICEISLSEYGEIFIKTYYKSPKRIENLRCREDEKDILLVNPPERREYDYFCHYWYNVYQAANAQAANAQAVN